MKDYVIFMDTAGDLSETYIQENDIRLVPMHYTLGKEDRICAKMEDEALLKRFYDGQRGGACSGGDEAHVCGCSVVWRHGAGGKHCHAVWYVADTDHVQ